MMHRYPSDEAWVEALQRGEPAAQQALLTHWLPVVVQWCNRLGGPAVDGEDAAHDVFLVVLRKLDSVWDADHLGPWLFGITRRVLAAHRRRAWVKRWVPGIAADEVEHRGPARLVEVSDTGRRVQAALQSMPEIEREVLVLCVLEDRADSEVSEMLGIPKNTVKSRLHRARDRFARAARAQGLDVGIGAEERA